MRTLFLIMTAFVFGVLNACGPKKTFEDKVKDDLINSVKQGKCDKIATDAILTNIMVGEVTPIGETGLIDVETTFSYEDKNGSGKSSWALLYVKNGEDRVLREVGSCKTE